MERFSFSNPAPESLFVALLAHINIANLDYEAWFRVSCGLKSSGCDYAIWDDWNRNDPFTARYTPRENRATWASIDPDGPAQFGTVMEHAQRGGFRPVNGQAHDLDRIFKFEALREAQRAKQTEAQRQRDEQDEKQRAKTAQLAAKIIERSRPATDENPYLERKCIAATSGMWEIDASELRGIVGYSVRAGSKPLTGRILVLPVVRGADLVNVEMIDGAGLKTALPGKGTKAGGYWAPDLMPWDTRDLGDGTGLTIAMGEGVATTLSGLKGFGKSKAIAVAALSSGNLPKVAMAMRERFKNARIVVLADLDKRTGEPDAGAVKAAQAVGGWLAVPEFQGPRDPGQKDFNDLWCKEGVAQVALSIDRARPVEPAEVADDPEVDDAGKTEFPPLPDTHRYPDYKEVPIDEIAGRVIEEMHRLVKSGGDKVVVFAGDVGSGKTYAVIREALQQTWRVAIFQPTHELADETAARAENLAAEMSGKSALDISKILRIPVAQSIRGRSAQLDKNHLYCNKNEFTKAIKEKGLSKSHKILGCKVRSPDGGFIVCQQKLNNECEFYKQKYNVARIKTLSHQYLTNDLSEMAKFAIDKIDLPIIDESPIGALTKHAIWTDSDTIKTDKAGTLGDWLKNPILSKVADAVLNKTALGDEEKSALLADVRASIGGWQETLPAVWPDMTDQPSADVVRAWSPNRPRSEYGMLIAAERWLSGQTASLYPDGGGIGSAWLEAPALLEGLPALIIDASANEQIYRAIFGDRLSYIRLNSPIAPDVDVIQLSDHSGYRAAMSRDERLVSQVSALTLAHKLHGHDCGLIGHKDHLGLITDRIGDTTTAHHGGLRGLNTLENKDALIVVGRSEPDVRAVERITRALFPTCAEFGETSYTKFASELQGVDGTTTTVPVHHPLNPLTNVCLQSVREEGLRQAIGRLRHTRPRKNGSSKRRLLIIATNIPIPNLKVIPATRAELFGSVRLCKALVKGKGVAILSPKWLHATLPDEFESELAAREWVRRERVVNFSIPVLNPVLNILSRWQHSNKPNSPPPGEVKFSVLHLLRRVSFRVAGTVGSFTPAVTLHPTLDKTRAALERALGATITAIGFGEDCEPVKPAEPDEAAPAKPSLADRRGNLFSVLVRYPNASNREIAKMAGVDKNTVAKVRGDLARHNAHETIDTLNPAPPAAMPATLETLDTLEAAVPASTVATVWTVRFVDGRTATLTTPGGASQAEAAESAKNLMGGVVAVVPRGARVNAANPA